MSTNALIASEPVAEPVVPTKRQLGVMRALFALAVVAPLIIGGVAYKLYFSSTKAEPPAATVYVEVPEMVVNLRSNDGRARFLKLRFIILAADEQRGEEVRQKLPLLVDGLQSFLRELRPEDLNGSAAVFRVKEEMMARATAALGAGVVRDVLIQDLVQQ